MGIFNKIKNIFNPGANKDYANLLDEDVVVNVEHISMEFKITRDKIDTLKEYVIRTLKR